MASRILFRSRIENAVEWDVVLPGSSIFRLRRRSLVRAVVLPLAALGASMRLAGVSRCERAALVAVADGGGAGGRVGHGGGRRAASTASGRFTTREC